MEAFDRNIPYNLLPPLPPATELYRDEEVLNKLMLASRRLAELKGLASTLPNQSIFVNTIALREAKASSAIKNIFTTDDELYRSLSYQKDDYLDERGNRFSSMEIPVFVHTVGSIPNSRIHQ